MSSRYHPDHAFLDFDAPEAVLRLQLDEAAAQCCAQCGRSNQALDPTASSPRSTPRLSPQAGTWSQIAARSALEEEYRSAGADALAQLAERFEVAETTIWRWRTGRSRIPRRALRRLVLAV